MIHVFDTLLPVACGVWRVSERDRDEEGKFTEGSVAYTDDDFLEAVDSLELPTTSDVGREVGCGRSTALRRLTDLEERGAITSRTVGKARVWLVD